VIYVLATMYETTNSSSTMISSPMVETSIPKTMLGTTVKLNGSTTCYGRRRSVYSLALKISRLDSFKIHLLLQILLMWPRLQEIILWWHDFSTV